MKITIALTIAALTLARLPRACAERLNTDDPNFRQLSALSEHIGWYQNRESGSWSVCFPALSGLSWTTIPFDAEAGQVAEQFTWMIPSSRSRSLARNSP